MGTKNYYSYPISTMWARVLVHTEGIELNWIYWYFTNGQTQRLFLDEADMLMNEFEAVWM